MSRLCGALPFSMVAPLCALATTLGCSPSPTGTNGGDVAVQDAAVDTPSAVDAGASGETRAPDLPTRSEVKDDDASPSSPDASSPDGLGPDVASPDVASPDVLGTDGLGTGDGHATPDTDAPLDSFVNDVAGLLDASDIVDANGGSGDTADIGMDAVDALGPEPVCEAELVNGRWVHGAGPPLAKIDPACGVVSYGWYANEGDSDALHLLPDFSFAGYMGGGVAIPDVAVVQTLAPIAGDNRAAIQAAIDAVSAMDAGPDGIRGAIFLSPGTYEVSDTLVINTGGVILRGAGQGSDGTILVATRPDQHDLIRVQGSGSGLGEVAGTRVAVASALVPVGATSFEVGSADSFAVGDRIALVRTPNQDWIDALGMGQWGWTASSYTIGHERTIVAIEGTTVTVDIPVVDAIEAKYGGGDVFKADLSGRIEQVGIEDLRLVSEYAALDDEQHGWNAVVFARAANSWVRRMTAVHFGFAAVNLGNESSFNTVEEVAQLDPISKVSGGRRYSFNVNDGVGNLFQRCYARDGRHNFVTGSRVTGPNVWLDSLSMKNNSDEGPHHRWSTGLLFDNCMSNIFNAQNRTSSGTGHGWAGAQTLFWNITAFDTICVDAPLGAMNWAIGVTGAKVESTYSPDEPFGWWQSHNAPVLPRSLYLAQLGSRLGPEALAAVATSEQLNGTIFQQLNQWAGKGRLADYTASTDPACDGIKAGSVCCPAACGVCGGTGCGALPGGSSQCCSGSITSAANSCSVSPPPCVLD